VSTKDLATEPCDPAQVTNLAELAACMRRLLARRGMSYSALTKAAELLPRRNGQAQTLPKSTVSDMLSGKRVPSKDKLLTLLAACQVPASDIPTWLVAWDRSCTSWIANSKNSPPPPPRRQRWRPIFISITATAIISVATTICVFRAIATSTSSSRTVAVVVVQNKWAGGTGELVEYDTPTYLSPQPKRCVEHSCAVDGTDMSSGALLPVTCQIDGDQRYNYNVDINLSKNPNKVISTLYYRGVFPNGRTGYISEVRVVASSRGGLGLPKCT
jgi:hypothetical protein